MKRVVLILAAAIFFIVTGCCPMYRDIAWQSFKGHVEYMVTETPEFIELENGAVVVVVNDTVRVYPGITYEDDFLMWWLFIKVEGF